MREPYPLSFLSTDEGSLSTFSCIGKAINIVFAYYYGQDKETCGAVVTSRIKTACEGKEMCNHEVSTNFFGFDPCSDTSNRLLVFYRCVFYSMPYSRSFSYETTY